jgi:hypothetical protein
LIAALIVAALAMPGAGEKRLVQLAVSPRLVENVMPLGANRWLAITYVPGSENFLGKPRKARVRVELFRIGATAKRIRFLPTEDADEEWDFLTPSICNLGPRSAKAIVVKSEAYAGTYHPATVEVYSIDLRKVLFTSGWTRYDVNLGRTSSGALCIKPTIAVGYQGAPSGRVYWTDRFVWERGRFRTRNSLYASELAASLSAIRRGLRMYPTDYQFWWYAAKAEAGLGRRQAARKALRNALEFSRRPVFERLRGEMNSDPFPAWAEVESDRRLMRADSQWIR